MKLNNKGFAISSTLYIILVIAVILVSLTLTILTSRKLIIDKIRKETLDNIYDRYELTYREVLNTLKQEVIAYATDNNITKESIKIGDFNTSISEEIINGYKLDTKYLTLVSNNSNYDVYLGKKETITGNNKKVKDLVDIIDYKIEGNSYQKTYTGKNLFDPNKLSGGEITKYNGKDVYKYTDGGVNFTYTDEFEENMQYRLTVRAYRDEGVTNNLTIYFYYTDGTFDYRRVILGEKSSFTSTAGKTIEKICGYDNWNKTAYLDLTVIQLEKGTEATDYEPYVGGKSSPNPQYPQEVYSVGDKSKNLIDYTQISGDSMNLIDGGFELINYWRNTSITPEKFLEMTGLKEGDTITTSFNKKHISGTINIMFGVVMFYSKDTSLYPDVYLTRNTQSESEISIGTTIIPEGFNSNNYNKMTIYGSSGTDAKTIITNFQVEKGLYTKGYEPYGLYKIPFTLKSKNLLSNRTHCLNLKSESTSYSISFNCFYSGYKSGYEGYADLGTVTQTETSITYNSETSKYGIVFPFYAKANTTYTFSYKGSTDIGQLYSSYALINKDTMSFESSNDLKGNSITVNVGEEDKIIMWTIYNDTINAVYTVSNLMVEEGDSATEYESYIEPTNIYLDNPLRKIENKIDSMSLSSSNIKRKVGIAIPKSTDDFRYYNAGIVTNNLYRSFILHEDTNLSMVLGSNVPGYCNVLPSNKQAWNKWTEEQVHFGQANSAINIIFNEEKATLDDAYNYLSNNGSVEPYFVYQLQNENSEELDLPKINTSIGTQTISIDTDIEPSSVEFTVIKKIKQL